MDLWVYAVLATTGMGIGLNQSSTDQETIEATKQALIQGAGNPIEADLGMLQNLGSEHGPTIVLYAIDQLAAWARESGNTPDLRSLPRFIQGAKIEVRRLEIEARML